MAQLGARLNGIEKVVGSNPTGSTFYKFWRSVLSTGNGCRPLLSSKVIAGVVNHLPASRGD